MRGEKSQPRERAKEQLPRRRDPKTGSSPTPEGSPRPPHVSASVRQEGFSRMEDGGVRPPKGHWGSRDQLLQGGYQPGRKMLSPAGRPGCRRQPAPHLGYREIPLGVREEQSPFFSAKVRKTRTFSFLLPPGSVKLFSRGSKDQFSEVPPPGVGSCCSICSQTLCRYLPPPSFALKSRPQQGCSEH